MILVGVLSWWYSSGFLLILNTFRSYLMSVFDLFSIDIMLKTLFSPFRQISANSNSRSVNEAFSNFMDKFISRSVGCVVRLFMVLIGCFMIVVSFIFELLMILIWLILPIVPIISLIGFFVL